MGIFAIWDESHKNVLHFVYRPQWSEPHFNTALVKAYMMLNEVDYPVGIVIDQQQVHLQPRDFLLHAQRLTMITRHRNADQVILLGVPRAFQSLRKIAVHRDNPFRNYHFAPTLEAAFEMLEEATIV